jgi:hypothetical protein
MDVPSTQGSDPYTQWISRLHREVAMIYEQSIRRPMYACQAHLKVYVCLCVGGGVVYNNWPTF